MYPCFLVFFLFLSGVTAENIEKIMSLKYTKEENSVIKIVNYDVSLTTTTYDEEHAALAKAIVDVKPYF